MNAAAIPEVVSSLARVREELASLESIVDEETVSAATAFKILSDHSDNILNLAAAIVTCVENESVTSVLPQVQALGIAVKGFIAERLEATAGILETVTAEVRLLRQLSDVASRQEVIALEIKVLSVLTNIEVARLGTVGAGFQYLARELAQFSKSVIEDTQELANHASSRRAALAETRRVLSAQLPRLREEMGRIETDLGNALAAVDFSLSQLAMAPAQFRTGVEDISRQIAGVVAALQSQDITRQMNEHVQHALSLISTRITESAIREGGLEEELPQSYAGLTIQIYQLKTIKQTVGNWIAQIRTCLDNILAVSAVDVAAIGPLVLEQEHRVSLQLVRIELLERASETQSERILQTLSGLSNLMQLVSEHLYRSKSIRDRIRLLAFNSIVEASHLGTRADVILAISKSIKEVSIAWSQITDHSAQAMQEIVKLVEQNSEVMKVFSPAGSEKLRQAQAQTRSGLESLRSAAELAAEHAGEMKTATARMQAGIAEIGGKSNHLDACFSRCEAVLAEIDDWRRRWEADDPALRKRYDHAEVERLFAASYTTELEREVFRAAIHGKALPLAQATLAGNSVELF